MAQQGKRYKSALEKVEQERLYPLAEAIALVKQNATSKFDETIDLAINLGIDPKQSDQAVRTMVSLPSGTGKKVVVAVFAKDDNAELAKKAGADIVGHDDLLESIQKGDVEFDRCVTTADMMKELSKVAKILGPKGLMPNPKLGTVTDNIEEAVKSAKSGQVEIRAEKGGIVHVGFGKASFKDSDLLDNVKAILDALNAAKPSSSKGIFIKKLSISSTMGPGIKIDPASIAGKLESK